MTQDDFKRLRYAGFSINLLGLFLSVGAWAYRMWLPGRAVFLTHHTSLAWILGGSCWVLGMLIFLGGWMLEP